MKTPKILFTTPVIKHPPVGGPELRVENSIKALSKIGELHLYLRKSREAVGGAKAMEFYSSLVKGVSFSPSVCLRKPSRLSFCKKCINVITQEMIGSTQYAVNRELEDDGAELLQLATKVRADVIWLGYGNISYPLLKYIKKHSDFKVVLDTDSVWSRFVMRELQYADDADIMEKIKEKGYAKANEEAWGTKLANVTTAVSLVDAEYYKSLANSEDQIKLFPNVIDPEVYVDSGSPVEGLKHPSIYLAGSFYARNCPMEDAARWLIASIVPNLLAVRPDIHLYIVGRGSKEILSDIEHPNITVTGELPSVRPYLCHVDVIVVPLRFESGTRFKILEAGACRKPVVSTTLGAEGIPVIHRENILIADTPADFSQAILELVDGSTIAQRLAANLQQFVLEKCSIDALVEEGCAILEYLDDCDASEK